MSRFGLQSGVQKVSAGGLKLEDPTVRRFLRSWAVRNPLVAERSSDFEPEHGTNEEPWQQYYLDHPTHSRIDLTWRAGQ